MKRETLILGAFALCLAGAPFGGATAQAQTTIRIIEEPQVSQPGPFATRGETVVVPRTRIEVEEGGGPFVVVPGDVPVEDPRPVRRGGLAERLNELEAGPGETVIILEGARAAGALQSR